MRILEATDYMKELFTQYWCKDLKYYCTFQNILGATPRQDQPFAVFNIRHYSANRATFNGLNKTKYRQMGYINIDLYVPYNSGMDNAYELAEGTMNLYRRPPSDCQINFSGFGFNESDTLYKNFFKVQVSIRFDYDYHF